MVTILNEPSPEVGDIYRDISLVANIEGFLAYRCIYVVYRQPLSEVSRWCCVDDRNFIPIIIDVVLILVNPNLIPSPCPVCNQIYHQEPATTFLACLVRDPSDSTLRTRARQLTLSRAHFIFYYHSLSLQSCLRLLIIL